MARTGRFGRLPGPGFDYSSIVGSLLAQYENARNANILSAWRDGGKFEGAKVTDGRLLAWFKARRNEYSKDDPEWDEWNQQITQFRYDIAEQKMMLQYARQNIGEGAVARWYSNSAGQFPRNSQAWRDAMINAARYRKAAQEKAAAARRSAAADQPSRTELYNNEMREVTRTHIEPANRAVQWYGEVLKGAGITGGGSWEAANIDALAGGHQQVRDWIASEDPWAARLRRQYEQRFGHEFSFQHFTGVINRGAVGSEKQVGIARKYKYYTAIPQLQSNKSSYRRYVRRARLVRNDRWSDYLEAQGDAEEALREADTPEERERIRQELATELEPMRQFFQRRGEPDAAYIIGETIDAATGGEVGSTASLEDAPFGQTGSDPRNPVRIDPDTGEALAVPSNSFNQSLVVSTQTDREQIEGLRDGTYLRIRNPEDGSIATVPRESFPEIASTHFLDNVLSVVPGITVDGKKQPPRSDAVYVEWSPGTLSVSDPDDQYTSHEYTPDGFNEFSVAETIDGELVYRYNKPNGRQYIGPIAPFDERIEVFGFSNGFVKISGQQVRSVDPTFFVRTAADESPTSIAGRAQSTLGLGAGSRSEVFSSNAPVETDAEGNPVGQAEPVTSVDRSGTPAEVARLRESLQAKEAEVADYRSRREDRQGFGRGTIIGSVGDLVADVEYSNEGLEKLEGEAQSIRDTLAGYESHSQGEREYIATRLQEAEAKVRAFYDSGSERFEGGVDESGNIDASNEFVEALVKRDELVKQARSVGIDVQEDIQEGFITGPGFTLSTARRTSIPPGAVEPPFALVDKPPVYSPVLTQADNPLASVVASESQWQKLSRMSPFDARIVYDAIVISNSWESDPAAKARLAHSMEAAFMAGEAGDTHLEWMQNYPGSSLEEAREMSQRMAFFRGRRQELDDSGVDFWEGIDSNDLLAERRRLSIERGLTDDAIDQEYPWLAVARPEPSAVDPEPANVASPFPAWVPQTKDLDTSRPQPRAKSARPITALDLMSQHPDALQADALTPPPIPPNPGDFDFQPPDVEAPAPSDYRAARPSWVVPPSPSISVPAPSADAFRAPQPTPRSAAPVSAAPRTGARTNIFGAVPTTPPNFDWQTGGR